MLYKNWYFVKNSNYILAFCLGNKFLLEITSTCCAQLKSLFTTKEALKED